MESVEKAGVKPTRQCVACRNKFEKRTLLRVVKIRCRKDDNENRCEKIGFANGASIKGASGRVDSDSKSSVGNGGRNDGFLIKIDFLQKFPGRGAYVCCDENCFKILKKKHCLEKSFRCFVDDDVYAALERFIKFEEV